MLYFFFEGDSLCSHRVFQNFRATIEPYRFEEKMIFKEKALGKSSARVGMGG